MSHDAIAHAKKLSSDLAIYDDVKVEIINSMGSDMSIVQAARVSMLGENSAFERIGPKENGLINYLMREKHGSPFEHTNMTFYVAAPIFAFREFQRHRIASYNEMSGRYSELPGNFYFPDRDRPLINIGTSAKPEMIAASWNTYTAFEEDAMEVYYLAWEKYKKILESGVAKEMARIVLPVGIFSEMYVSMNLRAMFNFLSLRVQDERSTHISRPQREIEMVAKKLEEYVANLYPVAYEAFNRNGRVAP